MKKLLLLLAAIGVIFTACEGGESIEEDNGGVPFVPEITISPKDLTFGCNGGEQAVDITANFECEVAERASWLTVEQNDEGLLVIVDENKNTSERSAFISITNSQYDINKSIEVWQEGFVPKIELAQQSIEVEFEPAEYEVGVTSPYSWEATTKNDWIVVESKTGIAGEEVLRFSTKHNEEEQERKGTITLKNTDYNLVAELYVIQKAGVTAITIEPKTLTFDYKGGTKEVAITANFEYEYSTNVDWLTIEKSEKGISVTVPNYVEVEERTAEITISNEKYGISKVVNVTQGAFVPEITFSPKSLTFDYKGGTKEVAITANFEYEYSTNVDWLTIEKSEKGVNITATTNAKFEECTAEITISSEKYGISRAITIMQQGVSTEAQNVIIIYTSSDGKIVTPNRSGVFGANIVSNTCRDGQGLIIFDAPVASIGNKAFYGCTSLTSITIPDSVTSIGEWAFAYCSSLTSVTIPNSVTSIEYGAFSGCSSLTSVTIGNSVTSIGEWAFAYCSSLTSVTIPDSVTSIGNYAFWGCKSLTSVTIGNGVTSIGQQAFDGCTSLTSVTIPDGVTSIVAGAFRNCTSLTSITIPDSVTSIGELAFYNCTSLTSVTIPDGVTSIGDSAFSVCTSLKAFYGKFASADNRCLVIDGVLNSFAPAGLTEYTIPNSVTKIGWSAFYSCTSLTRVTIPDSVTSIGNDAFNSCTSLTSVTIPDSVTSIGDEVFTNCSSLKAFYGKFASADNRCLIVDGVLNSFAPAGLTQYTIPDSVTSIGKEVFYGCKSLTSITIPDSVTEIGGYAFQNCISLTSVTIPDSVTSIGAAAFYYCTSLTRVYCKPTTPPTGGSYMFGDNASGRKIYVPRNSVNAYKAKSYWSDYASYIEGYDF